MESVLKEEGFPAALLHTLLATVEGSVGSREYARLYVQRDDGVYDVIKNGSFACAFFISSQLDRPRLIQGGVHTNVKETEEDLIASGWYRISFPVPGAIIIWAPKMASDKKAHRHIGLYLGDNKVVSTHGKTGIPTKHHVTYGTKRGRPVRPIEAIYFHQALLL